MFCNQPTFKVFHVQWAFMISLSILLSSCGGGKADDEFSISGTLTNLTSKEQVNLDALLPDRRQSIDSVMVEEDGSFSFTQLANPNTIYQLRLSTGYAFPFLPKTDELEFNADFKTPANWTISGNVENQALKGFLAERGVRAKAYSKAKQAHIMTPKSVGTEKWRAAEAAADMALIQYRDFLRTFIDTTSVPAFRGFAAFSMNIEANHYFLNKVAQRLQSEMPGQTYSDGLRNQLDLYGDMFVRIEPQDVVGEGPNGEELHLKDEVGKMTLVYFWASYCAFSRQENEVLKELYDEYKDQGFSIFALSIDDYKEDWQASIKEDSLNWPGHIWLKEAWNAQVFADWAVPSVPTTFLMDHRGVIMEKNIRADELKADMEELLKQYAAH